MNSMMIFETVVNSWTSWTVLIGCLGIWLLINVTIMDSIRTRIESDAFSPLGEYFVDCNRLDKLYQRNITIAMGILVSFLFLLCSIF